MPNPTPNTAELAQYIGRTGTIATNGLRINVVCCDVRALWGRVDYLVSPLSGSGSTWMSAVTFDPQPEPTNAAISANGL